jgi:hypothetical protein
VGKDNLVTISTTYTKLERVHVGDQGQQHAQTPNGGTPAPQPLAAGADGEQTAEAKVEIKRLYKCLQSVVSSEIKMHGGICCIIPERALVLKVFLQSDGAGQQPHIVFFFPVIL